MHGDAGDHNGGGERRRLVCNNPVPVAMGAAEVFCFWGRHGVRHRGQRLVESAIANLAERFAARGLCLWATGDQMPAAMLQNRTPARHATTTYHTPTFEHAARVYSDGY